MDTYCICVSSGATHYGGIEYWHSDEGGLDLKLTTDAAEELGIDKAIRIEHSLSAAQREEILTGLRRILNEPVG